MNKNIDMCINYKKILVTV